MDTTKILKLAFMGSVVLYGAVAFLILGAPDWSRPMVPREPGAVPAFLVFVPLALAVWAAGSLLGRRATPPSALRQESSPAPWARVRFVMGAALVESGAIFGFVLAFVGKDSRPALLTAAVSAVLLFVLPTEGSGRQAS